MTKPNTANNFDPSKLNTNVRYEEHLLEQNAEEIISYLTSIPLDLINNGLEIVINEKNSEFFYSASRPAITALLLAQNIHTCYKDIEDDRKNDFIDQGIFYSSLLISVFNNIIGTSIADYIIGKSPNPNKTSSTNSENIKLRMLKATQHGEENASIKFYLPEDLTAEESSLSYDDRLDRSLYNNKYLKYCFWSTSHVPTADDSDKVTINLSGHFSAYEKRITKGEVIEIIKVAEEAPPWQAINLLTPYMKALDNRKYQGVDIIDLDEINRAEMKRIRAVIQETRMNEQLSQPSLSAPSITAI